MNKSVKRNIIGSIICLVLSCLLGGIGIAVMMLREVHQSKKYGFPIEKDDIVRYSIVGALGYVVNLIIITTLL